MARKVRDLGLGDWVGGWGRVVGTGRWSGSSNEEQSKGEVGRGEVEEEEEEEEDSKGAEHR